MYRLRILIAALLFSLIGTVPLGHTAIPDLSTLNIPRYAPDRLLVKFKPGTAAIEIANQHMSANAQLLRTIPDIGVQLLQVPEGTVAASVAAYRHNPNVLYAEPDYYRLLVVPNEEPGPVIYTGAGNYFDEQWYLENTGQAHIQKTQDIFGNITLDVVYGTPGADINAPAAWDIETGLPGDLLSYDRPKIAVLDSGADCGVPDLAGKCLEKVSIVGATPGFGWDICPESDPACDNLGHGTFTANEAVAAANNGEGLVGSGYDSGAGIFKVCYQEAVTDGIFLYLVGLCPVSGSAEAILQASQDQYDNGLLVRSQYQVITMSYGSDLIDPATGDVYATDPSTAECDAIATARDRGVLVIAAAGNNGDSTKVYPAACTDSSGNSTVIAVAASDHEDDRASFSSYSRDRDDWVSLAAPGKDLIGLLPGAFCGLYANEDSCVDWWSGTSMSAPLVAGAAALVWSDLYKRLPPSAARAPADCIYSALPCNQAVRLRLEQNAAKVGANGQNLLSWTANGRLDMAAALSNDIGGSGGGGDPTTATVTAAFHYECSRLSCTFDAGASSSDPVTGLTFQWSSPDDSSFSGTTETLSHDFPSAGSYTVTLVVGSTESADSATVSADLNLQTSSKKPVKGDVSSGGGSSGGGGGSCTHPKGKC